MNQKSLFRIDFFETLEIEIQTILLSKLLFHNPRIIVSNFFLSFEIHFFCFNFRPSFQILIQKRF